MSFDLREGTVTHAGKTHSLESGSITELYTWITTRSSATTSLMSLVISEAHAIGPLAIGLIAFVITSGGILWRNSCRSAFMRAESRISGLHRTCEWDRAENRSSPEIRDLLRQIGSTENRIITAPQQSCVQHLSRAHRWLFFVSCADNINSLCGKIAELSRCLTAIRNRGAISDTELWREGPAPRRRGAPAGTGATGN